MKHYQTDKCPTVEQLAVCLDPVSDIHSVVAGHVEQCKNCRDTLSYLAGESHWWDEATEFLSKTESPAELRLGSRVCALTGHAPESSCDQLTEQELQHLKQLLTPPSHPELMGRINRYELEQLVGRGGMGLVFRAYDTELNRTVAVKILALHLIAIGSARERFVREARAVASLSHPHIVPIYDVVTDGEVPCLVMQFVSGQTLQERIAKKGSMPVEDVLRIGIQLCDALALAHSNGLVHRDIKPGNVLLEADGSRALLSDFGLVRALDDASLTHSGFLAGTPDFMSPEQSRGQSVDARSDLFSMGSVLYTMLIGHTPFRAPEPMAVLNRICHEKHRSACNLDPRIPIEVSQLIDRLLTKDPKHRLATAEQVRDRLRVLSTSPRRLMRTASFVSASSQKLWAAALVCAFLVMLAAHAWQNRPVSKTNIAAWPASDLEQQVTDGDEASEEEALGDFALFSESGFAELRIIDRLLNESKQKLESCRRSLGQELIWDEIDAFDLLDRHLVEMSQQLQSFEQKLEASGQPLNHSR
jgi:eukaryotic-like serine/threonine-protein kinase